MNTQQLALLQQLAAIPLDAQESERFLEDLQSILGYVDQLHELNVEGEGVLRESVDVSKHRTDEVQPLAAVQREMLLQAFAVRTKEDLLEADAAITNL